MKKLLFVLLVGVSIQTTYPMENVQIEVATLQNLHINTNHYEETMYANMAILTLQLASLVVLKSNDCLFSKPFPTLSRNNYINPIRKFVFVFCITLPLLFAKSGLFCKSNGQCQFFKGDCIKLAEIGTAIIHYLNLQYDFSLQELIKKSSQLPVFIKSKIYTSQKFLSKQQCTICRETPNKDWVNPCDVKTHVFCRKCITDWFNSESSRQNKTPFKCLLCMKEITPDNNKVLLKVPSIKNKLTLKEFGRSLINPVTVCACIVSLFAFYNVLSNF